MRFEGPVFAVPSAIACDRVGLLLDRNTGVDAPLAVPKRKLRKKRGSDDVAGVGGTTEGEVSGEDIMGDEECRFVCGDG